MPPISSRALEVLSPNAMHTKRESILAVLSKLSERDTSQPAVEELTRVIKVICLFVSPRATRT